MSFLSFLRLHRVSFLWPLACVHVCRLCFQYLPWQLLVQSQSSALLLFCDHLLLRVIHYGLRYVCNQILHPESPVHQLQFSIERDFGNAYFVRIKHILSINRNPFARQRRLQPDPFFLDADPVFPSFSSFA